MGLPEPEFQSLRGDFKVILRKEKAETKIQKRTEGNKLENQKQLKTKLYI